MGFSRQEYWSGLPFPSPGYLPDPGIEPRSLVLQADSLPTELWGKPHHIEFLPLNLSRTILQMRLKFSLSIASHISLPSPQTSPSVEFGIYHFHAYFMSLHNILLLKTYLNDYHLVDLSVIIYNDRYILYLHNDKFFTIVRFIHIYTLIPSFSRCTHNILLYKYVSL